MRSWHPVLFWKHLQRESAMATKLRVLLGFLPWTGSPEERRVYKKALAKILGSNITAGHTESPAERSSETLRNPGISGKFKLVEPPVFGKDVSLILILNNLSSDHKTVKVDMSASTVLYTRRAVTEILKATTSVDLGPKQGNLNVPEEPIWPCS